MNEPLTERELKLARALELVLAMATPVQSLPWERQEARCMFRTLDTIASTAKAALVYNIEAWKPRSNGQ